MAADVGEPVEKVVVTPVFDLEGDGFYDVMWPSDLRTRDGLVDLTTFPVSNLVVRIFKKEIETIEGFSHTPIVYALLDQPLGFSKMPKVPETLEPTGAVQLIELGEGCGTRVPVEVDVDATGDDFIPANTMRASPLPGFVLKPSTPYALIVLKDFHPEVRVERPEGFEAALTNPAYEPMVSCLEGAGVAVDDVAIGTVFTTQDAVREMRAIAAAVLDEAQVQDPVITEWRATPPETYQAPAGMVVYDGLIEMPIFQKGSPPYTAEGGFVFGGEGEPEVQRYEAAPFSVAMPSEPKLDPMPVLVFVDGTGAKHFSHLRHDVIRNMIAAGFAVVNFVPQFHEPRGDYDYDDIVTFSFNYLNPPAGRSVFRQQAAETIYLTRAIRGVLGGLEGVPALDTQRLLYGGHSQGALAGSIVAGVSDAFYAYGLNGLGAYISSTIVFRKDYTDLEKVLRDAVKVERSLDMKHPVVHLAQLGSDVVDPLNYAPYWTGTPGENAGSHVFVINGGMDPTSPRPGISALTIAADMAMIDEAGWMPDIYGIWGGMTFPTPFGTNRTSAGGQEVVSATYLVTASGHFTIFNLPRAKDFLGNFWLSAYQGAPVVR